MSEDWLDTGRHTRCPDCLSLDVRVRLVTSLEMVPASLKENRIGMEIAATETVGWIYKCFTCGDTGPAAMKTPEQHGKWIDGLGEEPYV